MIYILYIFYNVSNKKFPKTGRKIIQSSHFGYKDGTLIYLLVISLIMICILYIFYKVSNK